MTNADWILSLGFSGSIVTTEIPSMIFICGLAFYAIIGLIIAVAFVGVGVERVLAQPATLTTGARILLLPGAAALWPYCSSAG